MEQAKNDIEQLLSERMKLDEKLKTHFNKKVTIMFTDIKGSTSFYEQRGDLDGRLMVHRHNELVLPMIEANKGVLIKTIGDATMSRYEDAADGVRAAMQIQLKLRDHNKASATGEQIHVRIGLNTGMGIVEEKDVFGDVVNVAARVESLADGGEIFVTEDTYREVKNHDEFIFRYADAAKVRGKKEALKAYRLVWHEEDLHVGAVRSANHVVAKTQGVFVLEASVSGEQLKVSAFVRSKGGERAVKNYKEIQYHAEKTQEYTAGIISVLNRANRRGKIGNDLLVKLREFGALLFDALIPHEIKESLAKTSETNLMVSIDDRLVHIPWELLFDGKEFLCQRFSIGRSVSTRQAVSVVVRKLHRPLKMLVLADPRGDLQAAYDEGVSIKDEAGSLENMMNVSLMTTDITTDFVKTKMRNFDIVHYAGHAEHRTDRPENSGWLLRDGRLSSTDVGSMAGARPMPALVFSNACQTGQTDEWKLGEDFGTRIFGLANAFLLSGVQHYIGTFWEISDEAGAHFARAFYRNLVKGVAIGEAMRLARLDLIQKYGEDTIVWASYMLYGDPTTHYLSLEEEQQAEPQAAQVYETFAPAGMRGTEEVVASSGGRGGRHSFAIIAGISALIVAGVIAAFLMSGKGGGASIPKDSQITSEPQAKQGNNDTESAKRIDALVSDLAAQYRSGKTAASAKTVDAWSSKPLTLVFMDIKEADTIDSGTSRRLMDRLTEELQGEGSMQVVEREILDKLLAELKLSSSVLADPQTALKLGKLLSARIMTAGSIMPENKGMTITLRFIDTETSAVRKVVSVDSPAKEMNRELARSMAKGISEWIKADFPVQGKVLSVSGDTCMVNLGKAHGLKKGDKLELVKEASKGSGIYVATGQIEIAEVAKDQAQGRIIEQTMTVREGMQVRVKR